MNKRAFVLVGCAALSWAGCAELPSFPDSFGPSSGGSAGSGTSNGGSTVIPNGGSDSTAGTTPAGGTSTAAGSDSGGTGTTGGAGGTGTSAGSDSGGTGTSAGTSAGGTGMVDPQAEIDDAVKNLKAWRFENPCVAYNAGCQPTDICWEDSVNSSKAFKHSAVIAIGGVAGHEYDVTLRVRGVIEPRDYPSNCTFLQGGNSQNGATISIIEGCDGYGNSGSVTFNVWEFKIAEPAHVYYFNAVKTHPGHRVDTIDQTFTVRVAGGTKINFGYDDLNGGQIRNCTNAVQGVTPYPAIYDGQFFQLDVTDAKLAE
jgi:hypothetical protein